MVSVAYSLRKWKQKGRILKVTPQLKWWKKNLRSDLIAKKRGVDPTGRKNFTIFQRKISIFLLVILVPGAIGFHWYKIGQQLVGGNAANVGQEDALWKVKTLLHRGISTPFLLFSLRISRSCSSPAYSSTSSFTSSSCLLLGLRLAQQPPIGSPLLPPPPTPAAPAAKKERHS